MPENDRDRTWTVTVVGFDPILERSHESLLTLADGRIGTSGIPIGTSPATNPRVLIGGAYDGRGSDTHLMHAPVWNRTGLQLRDGARLIRSLDLRNGILRQSLEDESERSTCESFSCLGEPGLGVMRLTGSAATQPGSPLTGPSGEQRVERGKRQDIEWMRALGETNSMLAASHQSPQANGVVQRLASYDWKQTGDLNALVQAVDGARWRGYERIKIEQEKGWAQRWEEAGISIEGDVDLQLAVRFCLYQLIANVADEGEAAVGARGLTGEGYRGHVFWDTDIFVLPFFAVTHPSAARAILEYRIRRLPASMEAARQVGRKGARFAWESAADGSEVTPRLVYDRAGNPIVVKTGDFEEHITADVAWAASTYFDWTGDLDFKQGPGLQLLIETARYWASRITWDNHGFAHILGVIGPDEYHHDPVDDNAFTNVMVRWNLRTAASWAEEAKAASSEEIAAWRRLAEQLVDNYDPTSQLYEQFTGFHQLEPIVIRDVAPRRPITADLLLGYERIKRTQVVKQADVLMLHQLLPDAVAPGSLTPNYEYYEPRTAHGSSLSPAIHASLAARMGRLDEAVKILTLSARIDLDDVTGTTAGGLHIATMGGVWQALAFGFAGIRPKGDRLLIAPRLPVQWRSLEIPLCFRGTRAHIRINHAGATVEAEGKLAWEERAWSE